MASEKEMTEISPERIRVKLTPKARFILHRVKLARPHFDAGRYLSEYLCRDFEDDVEGALLRHEAVLLNRAHIDIARRLEDVAQKLKVLEDRAGVRVG